MDLRNGLYLGSSYYLAHHDPDDWDRDFARMASAGHNAVRTGELLASWDHMEQAPRSPDFSTLDAAFELAAKHGMRVLLGTGACCPPAWLAQEHPDLAIVDRDGISYPTKAMWSWACINHPAYLSESDRFLRQLLERYAGHEALLGWQVHNEPGYPFIAREDRSMPAWFDYNPHTIAAFRAWLQGRYNDIEALNEAWCWVPTNMRHNDFSTIDAPRSPPAEWGCPNAWLDWRLFTCANWDGLVRRQHDLIKEASPDAVTMVNIYGSAMDSNGRLGIDSWSMARQCDVIGYDLYPGQHMPAAKVAGRSPQGNPGYPAWFLDFARSTALHAKRTLWLPELESGPLSGWAGGPHYATKAADIRRWGLQALSRGARMILFQGYREWPCLPMHWGALVDWEGKATPRLEATQQLAEFMSDHAGLLQEATPVPAKVALLHSHSNVLFNAGCGQQDLVSRSMLGMYETLARLHFSVEFVSPEHLESEHGYQVIILPFSALISKQTAGHLASFVARGGRLISMPRTAMVDGNCQVWPRRPGGGLAEILGVREIDMLVEDEIEIVLANGKATVAGHYHRQQLEVKQGVDVLAEFAGGGAAVTFNRHKAGLAVHIATHLEMADACDAKSKFWLDLLGRLGVKPDLEIEAGKALLDCKIAQGPHGEHLFYMANCSAEEVSGEARVAWLDAVHANCLWPVGEVGKLAKLDGGGCGFEFKLPAWEGTVLSLHKHQVES